MKSEQEVKTMLKSIIDQLKTVDLKSKEFNPSASNRLENRALALLWVLELKPDKVKTLIFSKDQLKFYECFME